MTDQLTAKQKRDISFLVTSHNYSYAEAVLSVVKPQRRIRAPKSAQEIEQWIAAQKEQN